MPKGIFVLLLMLSMVAGVFAQDGEEDPFELPVLEDGEPITGTFTGLITGQLYVFVGSEGDEVTISMLQDEQSTLDPYLVLLDAEGGVIAYNDDSEDPNDLALSSLIEIQLPNSGLYLLLATQYGELISTIADESTEGGDYIVTVSGLTSPDIDDEDLILDAVLLESGAQETLLVTEESTVHYAAFAAEAGQQVRIVTSEGAESPLDDTLLYVFDPLGNRVVVADDVLDRYAEAEFTAEETGVYLIWATTPNYRFVIDDPENFFYVGSFDLSLTLR
jgi:hypothetical protein